MSLSALEIPYCIYYEQTSLESSAEGDESLIFISWVEKKTRMRSSHPIIIIPSLFLPRRASPITVS
jgi:hypothetical protein